MLLQIFHWTDSFIIGIFENAQSVGFYNVAMPIAMLLSISTPLFLQLFFPLVTKEYSKDRHNLVIVKDLSKQVGKWIFIINLPLLILFLIFPGVFINFFFGKEYLIAENALRFLAMGIFFNSLFMVSNNLLTMIGKSKIIMLDVLFISVINLVLNIVLVQRYSINGAAFASMISLILLSLLFLSQGAYYLRIIPLKRKMLRIFLISLIPTFLLLVTKELIQITLLSLIFIGILFGLLYVFLLFMARCLDSNDFLIIIALKKKFFK
jgi:O-antigen/teichoic acid export membrane protein